VSISGKTTSLGEKKSTLQKGLFPEPLHVHERGEGRRWFFSNIGEKGGKGKEKRELSENKTTLRLRKGRGPTLTISFEIHLKGAGKPLRKVLTHLQRGWPFISITTRKGKKKGRGLVGGVFQSKGE